MKQQNVGFCLLVDKITMDTCDLKDHLLYCCVDFVLTKHLRAFFYNDLYIISSNRVGSNRRFAYLCHICVLGSLRKGKQIWCKQEVNSTYYFITDLLSIFRPCLGEDYKKKIDAAIAEIVFYLLYEVISVHSQLCAARFHNKIISN